MRRSSISYSPLPSDNTGPPTEAAEFNTPAPHVEGRALARARLGPCPSPDQGFPKQCLIAHTWSHPDVRREAPYKILHPPCRRRRKTGEPQEHGLGTPGVARASRHVPYGDDGCPDNSSTTLTPGVCGWSTVHRGQLTRSDQRIAGWPDVASRGRVSDQ